MNANEIYQAIECDVPDLISLLDSGQAWIESGEEIAGRASDGVAVSLGSVATRRDRLNLKSYLTSCPSPEDW